METFPFKLTISKNILLNIIPKFWNCVTHSKLYVLWHMKCIICEYLSTVTAVDTYAQQMDGGFEVTSFDLLWISVYDPWRCWKDAKASDQRHKSILANVMWIIRPAPFLIIEFWPMFKAPRKTYFLNQLRTMSEQVLLGFFRLRDLRFCSLIHVEFSYIWISHIIHSTCLVKRNDGRNRPRDPHNHLLRAPATTFVDRQDLYK